jgi:hypothetical protein
LHKEWVEKVGAGELRGKIERESRQKMQQLWRERYDV